MPNVQNYVCDLGHETFAERPFAALDSLAFTQIVYMPMEGFPMPDSGATVGRLWAFLTKTYPDGLKDPFQQKRFIFTGVCAESNRFTDILVTDYVNLVDPAQETQFCACTFTLPDGSRYIAFRGTDLTVAGWKEDLNMSFKSVPAQAEAVAYVRRAAAAFDGALLLGGHSKGGHLALYAAAHVPQAVQKRIAHIYSFDGPGVDSATLTGKGYARISARIESYIPQSSVVGMLLCYHPVYQVVRSTGLGLFQHDAFTWQVRDAAFETLDGLDLGTRVADEALRQWIDRLTLQDRQLLTETTFRIISSIDPDTIDPLVQNLPGSSLKMFSAFRKLEPETRVEMRRMLGELFSSGASEAVRMLLPGTFRHAVEGVTPVSALVERIKAHKEEHTDGARREEEPTA